MTTIPVETTMFSPEELVRHLRALRERIPTLDPAPAPAALRRRLSHVDADFVQAAISAAGTSEVVEKALGRTDEDLRADVEVSGRWTAVADELRKLLQSVLATNTVRRQRIGLAALQTYKICQQLARDDNHAELTVHINEMKRLNKFGRVRRRPAPAPQPETAPLTKTA
ncbi:MAG TPA: hypothetical protein VNA69_00345 [Thermoanaerobaculia bacterium]|nr:hypothetical protein [Thermoanaerobaculia bacterium]